jgi:hypothetical protein
MKKLFIMMLLAVSATASATEVADNDTLTILKPQKVRIITGDSIQKIKVYGRENDSQYRYESKILLVDSNYVSETSINKDTWNFDFVKKYSVGTGYPLKSNTASMRLAIGLTYCANAKYSSTQSVGSSWEIMWTIMEWEKYKYGKHNGFSIGFGVDWRNSVLMVVNIFIRPMMACCQNRTILQDTNQISHVSRCSVCRFQ